MRKQTYGLMAGLALASVLTVAVAGLAPAKAAVYSWDFGSPAGTVTSPHTYTDTSSTYTITASGFTDPTLATWLGTSLYGKTDSGLEYGLGIASNGDHEIYGKKFIQIDVSAAEAAGLNQFTFQMGSVTNGEGWTVFGSDQTGSSTATLHPIYSAGNQTNDQGVTHVLTDQYKYYDFFYDGTHVKPDQGDNVLLHAFGARTNTDLIGGGVPELSTWAMMLIGFAGIGFVAYRRTKKYSAAILAA